MKTVRTTKDGKIVVFLNRNHFFAKMLNFYEGIISDPKTLKRFNSYGVKFIKLETGGWIIDRKSLISEKSTNTHFFLIS